MCTVVNCTPEKTTWGAMLTGIAGGSRIASELLVRPLSRILASAPVLEARIADGGLFILSVDTLVSPRNTIRLPASAAVVTGGGTEARPNNLAPRTITLLDTGPGAVIGASVGVGTALGAGAAIGVGVGVGGRVGIGVGTNVGAGVAVGRGVGVGVSTGVGVDVSVGMGVKVSGGGATPGIGIVGGRGVGVRVGVTIGTGAVGVPLAVPLVTRMMATATKPAIAIAPRSVLPATIIGTSTRPTRILGPWPMCTSSLFPPLPSMLSLNVQGDKMILQSHKSA